MNFPYSTNDSHSKRAFTLIELLVVITIIAVLAGLLLPVTQKVLENSRKVSAKSTESQIIAAVNAYQTDYGQYPVPSSAQPVDVTYGTDQPSQDHNGILFSVLRAQNTTDPTSNVLLNSRRVVYFESKNVKSPTNPRDGFIVGPPNTPKGNPNASPVITLAVGDLVDPWGNMYAVRIDSGYTNAVYNPYFNVNTSANDPASTASATDTTLIRTGVISWSVGNDGKLNTVVSPYTPTPGDDVVSWQ